MTRVLITGASGFLGSQLVTECQRAGFQVRACGRSANVSMHGLDYRTIDLRVKEHIAPLLEDVRVVIHAAGLAHQFGKERHNSQAFYEHNVLATSNMIESAVASTVKHFIHVSSVSVCGRSSEPIPDGATPSRAQDAYGISKYQAEQAIVRAVTSSNLSATILRLATLYGDNDPGNVGRLMRAIDRKRFLWIGRGENLKSLIHVNDAARACVRVVSDPPRARNVEIYTVSAPPCRMREIVEHLELALGRKSLPIRIPQVLPLVALWSASKLTFGRSRHWHDTVRKWLGHDAYDGSRFIERFAFQPSVSLKDGIAQEVANYRRAKEGRGARV